MGIWADIDSALEDVKDCAMGSPVVVRRRLGAEFDYHPRPAMTNVISRYELTYYNVKSRLPGCGTRSRTSAPWIAKVEIRVSRQKRVPMRLRYSNASPFVRKVLVFAHEAGLAQNIELVPTDVWAADTDIVRDNPLGKVPTLVT